jgi:hypothetical protein
MQQSVRNSHNEQPSIEEPCKFKIQTSLEKGYARRRAPAHRRVTTELSSPAEAQSVAALPGGSRSVDSPAG